MENKEKNNKVIYWVVGIIVIIAIIIAAYFLFFKDMLMSKNIDLNSVSASITSTGGFDQMATLDITKEIANTTFNIPTEYIEEIYGKMPMINVQASLYAIIKTTDDKVDEVRQKLEEYGDNYQKQWETYLPEQLDLVKNRIISTKGNYVYIIIAENATELEKLIK